MDIPHQDGRIYDTEFIGLLTTSVRAVRIVDWQKTPSSGIYSVNGFDAITTPSGTGVEYKGNVGEPYGSNIVEVSASAAANFKYIVRFQGPESGAWTVAIWNKFGPFWGVGRMVWKGLQKVVFNSR
jgi:hypothetical protein